LSGDRRGPWWRQTPRTAAAPRLNPTSGLRGHSDQCCKDFVSLSKEPVISRPEPIPQPPGHPFIGNLFDVDMRNPVASLMDLARKYGPIYRLSVRNRSRVVASGHELVAELCDDTRFDKTLGPITKALAMSPVGRGLFTTETADP